MAWTHRAGAGWLNDLGACAALFGFNLGAEGGCGSRTRRAAGEVTEDWRMAVAAEMGTSSMGDEESEMEVGCGYDSSALSVVVD